MQYKSKIVWWKPENAETFQQILKVAKGLYLDQGPILITKYKLAEIINKIIDKMLESNELYEISALDTIKGLQKINIDYIKKILRKS